MDQEAGCSKWGERKVVPAAPPKTDVEFTNVLEGMLVEFLEVAMHALLYHRDIYPKGFFQRRKKYEIPVWICMHPAVETYVQNCLESLRSVIGTLRVDAVMLVIFEPNHGTPVERFTFRIIPDDYPEPNSSGSSNEKDKNKFYFRFGESLKAFLLRIAACKSYLKPLPPNCTCRLQIVTDSQVQLVLSEDEHSKKFPWIEADDKERDIPDTRMQSVRGSTKGVCPMEVYVEEVPNKFAEVFKAVQRSHGDPAEHPL